MCALISICLLAFPLTARAGHWEATPTTAGVIPDGNLTYIDGDYVGPWTTFPICDTTDTQPLPASVTGNEFNSPAWGSALVTSYQESIPVAWTLVWVPDPGKTLAQDPPPDASHPVTLCETASAQWLIWAMMWDDTVASLSWAGSRADNGWGIPVVESDNVNLPGSAQCNGISAGSHLYRVDGSSGTITLPSHTLSALAEVKGAAADYPGFCNAWANLNDTIAPVSIHLVSPNPAIHPEVGNDSHRQNNQFVYGATQIPCPTAFDSSLDLDDSSNYLAVPVTLAVSGITADVLQSLLSQIQISITPTIPNLLPYTLAVLNNQLVVETEYYNPQVLGDPGYVYFGFLCDGLPKNNSDFGNHQVTLTANGQVIDVANIQTFFQPFDCTHPVDALNPLTYFNVPNFYYYYNQVYNSPGMYSHTVTGTSYTDQVFPHEIYLDNDAYAPYSLAVFDNGPDLAHPGLVRWVGTIGIPQGLIAWIHTCAHEQGHKDLWNQGGVYNFSLLGLDTQSHDGDHVNDDWEATHFLDNTKADTTGAYLGGGEPGDDELLADVAALPAVMGNISLWSQDWSCTGIQHGFLLPELMSPGDALFDLDAVVAGKDLTYGASSKVESISAIVNEYPGAIVHGALP